VVGLVFAAAPVNLHQAKVVRDGPVTSKREHWRSRITNTLAFSGVAFLLAGWWFIRNILLYGEPTGVIQMLRIWGGRDDQISVPLLIREVPALWSSFWGRFGYGQIPLPAVIYHGLAFIAFLSALGWAARLYRAYQHCPYPLLRMRVVLILVLPMALLLLTVRYMIASETGANGRYLFPALPSVAIFLFVGLASLVPKRCHWALAGAAHGMMLGLSLIALLGYLRPAYARPRLLFVDEISDLIRPLDVQLDDKVQLLGYNIDRNRVKPGDEITITLCWKGLRAMDDDYIVFVHLLGLQNLIAGRRETHPGLGLYPTSQWSPGDVFCDVLHLRVESWAPTPAIYQVEVGLFSPDTHTRLIARNSAGILLEPLVIDTVKVRPLQYSAPRIPYPLEVDLGEVIRLKGYNLEPFATTHPGETIRLDLYWQAVSSITQDYTVFVHLRNPQGETIAQADSPPQEGKYPTSWWDVGEIVTDTHFLTVPQNTLPGRYTIYVGMYLLDTGERLPVTSNPNGEIVLCSIVVDRER